jgi:PTS system mannose-specific IID component
MNVRPVRVSAGRLWQVAVGVLSLQATFNPERRLGLGVAVALSPLRVLWKGGEDRRRFFERHLESFNTNPALAGPLLGAVTRLEERAAGGEPLAEERIRRVKAALEAPLAAVGDALLWSGARPATLLWGGAVALVWGWWGPVLFLILYNAVHLGLRLGGFFWGYRRGEGVSTLITGGRLRRAMLGCTWLVGSGAVILAVLTFRAPGGAQGLGLAGMVLGLAWGRRGFAHGALPALGGMIVGLILSVFLGTGP